MRKQYRTPEMYSGDFTPELRLLDVSGQIEDFEMVDDTWDY